MNQLAMDKSFAINNLRRSGYSERRIAETLGVSRGAVRRHLRPLHSNGTKAPTGSGGQTTTPHEASNSTKAPTGSEANPEVQNTTIPHVANCSHCEPFRDLIVAKFNLGLTAKRIHQDLVAEHGFDGKYWSVNWYCLGRQWLVLFEALIDITIQIDEQTAKTLESAASVAGLTLAEYIRSLAEADSKPVVQAAWDKLEREFEELSVDGSLPKDFSRADIYSDHD